MKKSVNKIALVLWIVAAIFVLAEAWSFFDMFQAAAKFRQDTTFVVGGSILRMAESVVTVAGMLTGMGMLIELVDQIRWTVVRTSAKI